MIYQKHVQIYEITRLVISFQPNSSLRRNYHSSWNIVTCYFFLSDFHTWFTIQFVSNFNFFLVFFHVLSWFLMRNLINRCNQIKTALSTANVELSAEIPNTFQYTTITSKKKPYFHNFQWFSVKKPSKRLGKRNFCSFLMFLDLKKKISWNFNFSKKKIFLKFFFFEDFLSRFMLKRSV